MLAIAQVVVLMTPSMLAPTLFLMIRDVSDLGRKVFVMGLLLVSIVPLYRPLKFEAAYRRVRGQDIEKRDFGNEVDEPYFGDLQ